MLADILQDQRARMRAHAEDDRHRRIAEAAYYKSERRGFAPGRDLDDWLEAEEEVDAASRPHPSY